MEEIHKRKAEVKRSKMLNDQAEARRQRNKDARRRREERINAKLEEFLQKADAAAAPEPVKEVEKPVAKPVAEKVAKPAAAEPKPVAEVKEKKEKKQKK